MSWFSNLIGGGVDEIVDSVGDAIDRNITNDEEKMILKNELQKEIHRHKESMVSSAVEFDKELTTRHANDMNSDSWLSKNIRPLTLIFILTAYTFFSIGSGFEFEVKETYVELLGQWGIIIMGFYFGGRTAEKMAQAIKGAKNG